MFSKNQNMSYNCFVGERYMVPIVEKDMERHGLKPLHTFTLDEKTLVAFGGTEGKHEAFLIIAEGSRSNIRKYEKRISQIFE